MSAIIATIGGYDISRVGHRVVYIKGFTRRYSSYRQEAITLQESGAGSYNRGKSQGQTLIQKQLSNFAHLLNDGEVPLIENYRFSSSKNTFTAGENV